MSLDDAEIKAIQAANENIQQKANEMIAALYREAAGKDIIACGRCHEPTAAITARARIIIPDSVLNDQFNPDVTHLKLTLVCPRCFDLP